jgi:hypothetical protein
MLLIDELFIIPRFSLYKITRSGRLFNLSGYEKLFYVGKNGYLSTRLINDQKRSVIMTQHRLLALTFLTIPNNHFVEKLDVNHINGIKTDNRLENLEWVTRQENCNHAYRTGLRNDNVVIHAISIYGLDDEIFYSMGEAGRFFNVTAAAIHWQLNCAVTGKSYKGYYLGYCDGRD